MRLMHLAVSASLTLAGCAHSSFVLLPDEYGGTGEIAVLQPGVAGGETIVREANTRATLGGDRPSVRPLGPKGLKPGEAALLAALPPPAKSFTLYFQEGTTELTAQSVPVVEQIRQEVATRPGAEVQVTGHTDTVGSVHDNDRLSKKRADEVMSLLASRGFARAVMTAVGRGERELRAPTADGVESPTNRRVEVVVR